MEPNLPWLSSLTNKYRVESSKATLPMNLPRTSLKIRSLSIRMAWRSHQLRRAWKATPSPLVCWKTGLLTLPRVAVRLARSESLCWPSGHTLFHWPYVKGFRYLTWYMGACVTHHDLSILWKKSLEETCLHIIDSLRNGIFLTLFPCSKCYIIRQRNICTEAFVNSPL